MRVTHGCIRLYPDDIEELFQRTSIGTDVQIINQPIKTGWFADQLYLEVHPPLNEYGTSMEEQIANAIALLSAEVTDKPYTFRSNLVRQIVKQHTGIPTLIPLK